MGRRKKTEDSEKEGILSDLVGKKRGKLCTLSVDADTYNRVSQVAEALGVSRPRVIESFVKSAYEDFIREAQSSGIDFDPNKDSTGSFKWSRNNGKEPTKNKKKG